MGKTLGAFVARARVELAMTDAVGKWLPAHTRAAGTPAQVYSRGPSTPPAPASCAEPSARCGLARLCGTSCA